MLRVKICGITNLKDAMLSVELGADALGFIFAPSPRRIEPLMAREIIKRLPPFITTVGVFANEDIQKVKEISSLCGICVLQFHGDEPPQYCKLFSGKVIKAFKIEDKGDLEKLKEYEASAFLLDSPKRGQPFDWNLLRDFRCDTPVILAGGLNPYNLELVLSIFRPYAVDVSSGVEAYPGKKDETKLRRFMEVIRKWREKDTSVPSGDALFPKP